MCCKLDECPCRLDFDYSKLITNPNNRGSICYKLFIDEAIPNGFQYSIKASGCFKN